MRVCVCVARSAMAGKGGYQTAISWLSIPSVYRSPPPKYPTERYQPVYIHRAVTTRGGRHHHRNIAKKPSYQQLNSTTDIAKEKEDNSRDENGYTATRISAEYYRARFEPQRSSIPDGHMIGALADLPGATYGTCRK